MTYWDFILKEIIQKKNDPSIHCQFIYHNQQGSNTMSKNTKPKPPRKKYFLGDKYPRVYFGPREAQCMRYALKGKTIPGIAVSLALSPRTVEYYFQKMRWKLKCRTKSELIERILETDFLKAVESI